MALHTSPSSLDSRHLPPYTLHPPYTLLLPTSLSPPSRVLPAHDLSLSVIILVVGLQSLLWLLY